MKLSILDFGFPGTAIRLVTAADRLGYHRFWLGEHHTSCQCANPLLLGPLLLGTTRRLRLGTGGVCLSYRTPFQIAEDARLVEFMFPGHFDLGVTRGLLSDAPLVETLLDGRPSHSPRLYHEKLVELHGLVTGRLSAGHPLAGRLPYLEAGPPMWALGTGERSARIAGHCGMGFCFSLHHARSGSDGRVVLDAYRQSFQPSPEFPEPTIIVVISGICASSRARLEALESRFQKDAPEVPSGYQPLFPEVKPVLRGTPEEAAEIIDQVACRFGVDEIMILDLLFEQHEEREEMYELLAEACGLQPLPDEGEEDL